MWQEPLTPIILLLAASAAVAAGLALGWRLGRARLASAGLSARRAIVEDMADGVIVLDAQNRVVDVNPAALRLVGFSRGEVLGQKADDLLADWPELAANPGQPLETTHTAITLDGDGTQRVLELHVSPLTDEHTRLTYRLVVLCDVTSERSMHEKLQVSEAHFQGILDAASSAILAIDEEQRIIVFNRMAEHIFGYEAVEVLGRPLAMLLPERSRDAHREHGEAFAASDEHGQQMGRRVVALYGRRKDGEEFPIEASLSRFEAEGRPVLTAVLNDITLRQQTEKALLDSEAKFRTLAETTPAAICLARVEPETRGLKMLYINSAAEVMTGYTHDELMAMDIRELIHPASRDLVSPERLGRLPTDGQPSSFQIRIMTREGDTRWVSLTAVGTHFDGEPAILSTAFDITTAKRVEDALKLSEDRYRILVENINDVIFALDIQGNFTYVSPVIERLSQYRASDIIGKPFSSFVHPEDLHEVQRSFGRALAGQPQPVEFRVQARDGSTLHVRANSRPVLADGQPLGLTGTLTDITESKLREEEIRKLSRAVNQSPSAVLITDPQGTIEYVNPKFCQMSGYDAGEVLGQNPRLLKSGETPDEKYAELWRTLSAGGEWQGEFQNRRKNGELYWVSVSISPIRDSGGTITHFVAVQEDITERKRMQAAEREQRVLAEALRDTAAALTSTLDLDEVLERILANAGRVVPHDFSTVMLIQGGVSRVVRSTGLPEGVAHGAARHEGVVVEETPELRRMVESGQPLLIDDYTLPGEKPGRPRSYMGAPIRMGGETLGFLNLYLKGESQHTFSPAHLDRLQVFADEAAIAIHNAQLYEQAQQMAMMEERQRLARDLHDAVSQTLFSANVIAQMLPRMLAKNPDEVLSRLDQLHMLTQGALAEMRALLLELRPAALADAQLPDLLRYLTDALTGRKQITVTLDVDGQPELPPEVKVAFYRIAQEALNNVAKHSNATETHVTLSGGPEGVEMCICDNGRGIDPERVARDQMGLTIMRERAEAIGADFRLSSQPGSGTEVAVCWPEEG